MIPLTVRGAKRILWVDDEVELLRPHVLFLQARGYHVDAISNGDDALSPTEARTLAEAYIAEFRNGPDTPEPNAI